MCVWCYRCCVLLLHLQENSAEAVWSTLLSDQWLDYCWVWEETLASSVNPDCPYTGSVHPATFDSLQCRCPSQLGRLEVHQKLQAQIWIWSGQPWHGNKPLSNDAGMSQGILVSTATAHQGVIWLAACLAALDSLLCRYLSQLGELVVHQKLQARTWIRTGNPSVVV